ncbi:MAG: TlpA family protein disulfide reductase [Nevskiaceae bacterium]|nr:MAG: TlpA family protein disulfide reductase [Nevskiaceae bacterium]
MKPATRKTLLIMVLALAGVLAGFWTSARWSTLGGGGAPQPAPALAFEDLDGKTRSLSDWRGKLLLVNFWATWCAPCLKEMPLLIKAQKQFGARGLQVVGPALDDADAVRKLAAQLGVSYPVMADFASADKAMSQLGNTSGALPFSVFIDAQGRIVKTVLGGLHEDDLNQLVVRYLPQ